MYAFRGMGTIRSEDFHRRPCLCGAGEIVIDFCETDHAWRGGSEWYEARIVGCPVCAGEFVLERGRRIVAIRREEIEKRKQAADEAHTREKALRAGPNIKAIRASLEASLADLSEPKEIRARLNELGLPISPQRLAAEIRKFGGDTLRAAMAQFDLDAILRAAPVVGREVEATPVQAELTEIGRLREFGWSKPPQEGPPIYPPE